MIRVTAASPIAICLHFSLEHYRGGEKWASTLANRLHRDGVPVEVRALPYAPGGVRRTSSHAVLDSGIPYTESWSHDLSHVSHAYLMYAPGMRHLFRGADMNTAGIHSWAFVSSSIIDSHYSALHNGVKLLFNLVGTHDLTQYDRVHTVTPVFEAESVSAHYIPNFVDREFFHPDRKPLTSDFQVLIPAANVPEKGWDLACKTASLLDAAIRVVTTGDSDCPHIHGLGYLSERKLADTYASSHAVLHPARVDTDSMVINEACASGTPVVTTPIETHVRENEAVIHAGTPWEMAYYLRRLRTEWEAGDPYAHRCEVARQSSHTRDIDRVYPQLKSLLLDAEPEQRPTNPLQAGAR